MYQFRFKISKETTEDYRPVNWPIDYPYWCYGENDTHFYLMAYEESKGDILRLWPEAKDIKIQDRNLRVPVFTSRFPCPPWYRHQRMDILRRRYTIFEPEWSWGTANILVRKDGAGLVHINHYKDGSISISDLFVQPEAREKGIGLQLLSDAEEIARLHNHTDVFLWADPEGWCKEWYYRQGYRIIPNAQPTPSGDIYMQKDFSNYKAIKK